MREHIAGTVSGLVSPCPENGKVPPPQQMEGGMPSSEMGCTMHGKAAASAHIGMSSGFGCLSGSHMRGNCNTRHLIALLIK